jgi:uncharacterized membrane protein YhaH (DUF805 family)
VFCVTVKSSLPTGDMGLGLNRKTSNRAAVWRRSDADGLAFDRDDLANGDGRQGRAIRARFALFCRRGQISIALPGGCREEISSRGADSSHGHSRLGQKLLGLETSRADASLTRSGNSPEGWQISDPCIAGRVTIMEMRDTLRFFFSFRGRISRSRFWLGFLMLTALQLMLLAPFLVLDIREESAYQAFAAVFAVVAPTVSSWALIVRRLHDLDLSGLFLPLGMFIWPVLGMIKGTEGANRFGDDPLARP